MQRCHAHLPLIYSLAQSLYCMPRTAHNLRSCMIQFSLDYVSWVLFWRHAALHYSVGYFRVQAHFAQYVRRAKSFWNKIRLPSNDFWWSIPLAGKKFRSNLICNLWSHWSLTRRVISCLRSEMAFSTNDGAKYWVKQRGQRKEKRKGRGGMNRVKTDNHSCRMPSS